ncbi:MAG: hypothetical protein JXA09_05245, partial [Anaerolineae bacterium]|nr:hypothetical protein [Anaerolineae bacterium]
MVDSDLVVRGMLPLTIVLSAVLTLPLSLFLLWLYRRAVVRGMQASAGLDQAPPQPPGARAATVPHAPLTIAAWDERAIPALAPAA